MWECSLNAGKLLVSLAVAIALKDVLYELIRLDPRRA